MFATVVTVLEKLSVRLALLALLIATFEEVLSTIFVTW